MEGSLQPKSLAWLGQHSKTSLKGMKRRARKGRDQRGRNGFPLSATRAEGSWNQNYKDRAKFPTQGSLTKGLCC
jgi:outer membrane protein assembly factor BamA